VVKALYLSFQNTMDCYKLFCLISKFWSPTQLFFPLWNISSIIPLVSITYLVLVYNYNTIKYICFINSQKARGNISRIRLLPISIVACLLLVFRTKILKQFGDVMQESSDNFLLSAIRAFPLASHNTKPQQPCINYLVYSLVTRLYCQLPVLYNLPLRITFSVQTIYKRRAIIWSWAFETLVVPCFFKS
jgi:hypothetical protein